MFDDRGAAGAAELLAQALGDDHEFPAACDTVGQQPACGSHIVGMGPGAVLAAIRSSST
ncbi:hypothetical protein FHX42_001442 [Saccharopolyspora lacisalsi]|uniref:Uncharacterized protein n=1 Tax=Halosaccharopolyspora lacisalsi TaxID=1000566 RepID=A0A839DSR3_9PSEU|nr:hypothetical protein [Halosaccharopolyspora lacisalsi]